MNFKVAVPGRDETVAISRVKMAFCSIQDAEDAEPPPRPPQGPRPQRPRPPRRATDNSQQQRKQIQRIGSHIRLQSEVPRGRARPILSDDEDLHPPPPMQQQPVDVPLDYPPDYDISMDDVPVWSPPAGSQRLGC